MEEKFISTNEQGFSFYLNKELTEFCKKEKYLYNENILPPLKDHYVYRVERDGYTVDFLLLKGSNVVDSTRGFMDMFAVIEKHKIVESYKRSLSHS